MPLLNLRTSWMRGPQRRPDRTEDLLGQTRDALGSERPRLAANEGAVGVLWDRNLSWEQREAGSRMQRARSLLSVESGNARVPAGAYLEKEHVGTRPLLATCMNPHCGTHWLRLWRRRQVPRMEGQWACSPECMRALVENAVAREMAGESMGTAQPHQHRIPMGLLLLAQGWITEAQLRAALEAQRTVGKGRIGTWLMRLCNLPEERVTRALSIQWGCPVFTVINHQPGAVAALVPRLLLDSFGLLPVRVASRRILYLGFEDRIDAAAALAVERMSGLRVETGVVTATQYLRAHERMMDAAFPKAVLMDAGNPGAVAEILTGAIERVRPHDARLVRMHEYFWLRMWRTPLPVHTGQAATAAPGQAWEIHAPAAAIPRLHQVEDLLCRYRPPASEV